VSEEGRETVESIAARVQELTLANERLFGELLATQRRFQSLSRSVWRVQEDERRKLARELHDGIGQTLTALKNQLEGKLTGETLAQAREMAAQALHDTRELSRLLRPAVLDDLGLAPALRWLTRFAGERLALSVELRLSGLPERLDREIETFAFRVVQEALTNVAKHAGAARAEVDVDHAPGHLRIRVADDGSGFDPGVLELPGESGSGLRGMRERAQLFGGVLRVDSGPGGTRIEVGVPL
jgi:two-component system, NarL family, sensor kinase